MPVLSLWLFSLLSTLTLTEQARYHEDMNSLHRAEWNKRLSHRYSTDESQCDFVFSVFGFLSFILALLDLVIIISSSSLVTLGRSNRGPRDLRIKESIINLQCSRNYDPQNSAELAEAAEAAFVMLRGFLNAMSSKDHQCIGHLMCRSGKEASRLGSVGRTIANVTRLNAAVWLQRLDATLYSDVEKATSFGIDGEDCQTIYSSCPSHRLDDIPINGGTFIKDHFPLKNISSYVSMHRFLKQFQSESL